MHLCATPSRPDKKKGGPKTPFPTVDGCPPIRLIVASPGMVQTVASAPPKPSWHYGTMCFRE